MSIVITPKRFSEDDVRRKAGEAQAYTARVNRDIAARAAERQALIEEARTVAALAATRSPVNDDPVARAARDPEVARWCNSVLRALTNCAMTQQQRADAGFYKQRALLTTASPGQAWTVATAVADAPYDNLPRAGALATFTVVPMGAKQSSFAYVSVDAAASLLTEGAAITADTALAGGGEVKAAAPFGVLVHFSEEWAQDTALDLAEFFLRRLDRAMRARLDWTALHGSGAADADSGGWTGILNHGDTLTATATSATLPNLSVSDLLLCADRVAAGAIQNGCRWYAHPALLPDRMRITDPAGQRVVTTAIEGGWQVLGFELVLTNGMPSAKTPGSPVLLFGDGLAYAVGLRKNWTVERAGPAYLWSQNLRGVRAIGRAAGQMLRGSSFCALKLAAS